MNSVLQYCNTFTKEVSEETSQVQLRVHYAKGLDRSGPVKALHHSLGHT